jgi:glycosyltransferase involved in cell wall biosynthesis
MLSNDMAMKVAMITDHPESNERIDGGVQAVASYLVNAITELQEIDLHVLSFRLGSEGVTVTKEPNFTRYSLPFSRFGTLTAFARDQAVLNACLADIRPDIVHSQGGGHHGIVAIRSGYPTVVTVHGILAKEANFLPGIRRRMRSRFQGWMADYYCVRRASHTILISPYVASHYGSALSGKQYLIPNPVHRRFFDVVRRETPGRILFAGRLYALKGVKDLLNSVSRITKSEQLRVVLAGSVTDERYVNELRAEASRLNMTDIVDFRGILRGGELLEEFSRCACLVLPSYQETAPMVIQEAMASGLPVVASNICGIPYQVDDGNSGFLFPPGDIDALAHSLSTLLSDQSLRERFSAAGRRRAEREYRAEAIARKTLDVYREMI